MSQQIICLSGRKQSGKNTAINFMVGLHMTAIGLIRENFTITDKGELWISDINGDKEFEGVFDIFRGTPAMEVFLADHLDQYIKVYSFADLLKTEICMKVLGLTYEQCYGTDEQKNSLTHLKWENMPGIISNKLLWEDIDVVASNIREHFTFHEPGPMTSREVLQYVGSNIFRKMYGDVWVDATIKRIQDEGSSCALICDCRFPNEVEGVQKVGGKVIRLTRNPHPNDSHISETALDNYTGYDAVIDNINMSIPEQNDALYQKLVEWKMSPMELEINKQ
jgi:hypothetical protein